MSSAPSSLVIGQLSSSNSRLPVKVRALLSLPDAIKQRNDSTGKMMQQDQGQPATLIAESIETAIQF